MASVLVTGGVGLLGSVVVRELRRMDATVRILSHHPAPPEQPGDVQWARVEFRSDTALAAAVAGIDTVVHCGTNPLDAHADVEEAKALLAAAREANVRHFLFVSIVGIDPLGFFDYYRAKLEIERLVATSGIPYSILRAAQFHQFVVYALMLLSRGPFLLTPPGVTLQPVAVDAVGERLAAAALAPPAGRLPDVAGPDLLPFRYLARTWLRASHRRAVMVPVSLPIPAFRAMRQLTFTDAERIGESWDDWLAAHAHEPSPYRRVLR